MARHSFFGLASELLGNLPEHHELPIEVIPHIQECPAVPASVAVIGGREYRHHSLPMVHLISSHGHLVSSRYAPQLVLINKLIRHVCPEVVTHHSL